MRTKKAFAIMLLLVIRGELTGCTSAGDSGDRGSAGDGGTTSDIGKAHETGVNVQVLFDDVLIDILFSDQLPLDQFKLTMTTTPADAAGPVTQLLPKEDVRALSSVYIAIADDWGGRSVEFQVDGLAGGEVYATGKASVVAERGNYVGVRVTLVATRCIPNCTERTCGPDPVCGASCGPCSDGLSCTPDGLCLPAGCPVVGPQAIDDSEGSFGSLGVDSSGNVHVSYFDRINEDLKYATNASGSWHTSTIGSEAKADYGSALGVDSSGKVHINYNLYKPYAVGYSLRYATNASGSWQNSTIDPDGEGGSLGLDSAGNVHVSYYDKINGDLEYATNASGSWQSVVVDSEGDVGARSSIALDSSGKVHILYETTYDPVDIIDYSLKYATNASGSWHTVTLDAQGGGSLQLDSSGKVHIGYMDAWSHFIKYTTNASGSWQTVTVDSAPHLVGASLALDSSGKAHIGYFSSNFDSAFYTGHYSLKYATNARGSWRTLTVVPQGTLGALAIDRSGRVHMGYTRKYRDAQRGVPDHGQASYISFCPP